MDERLLILMEKHLEGELTKAEQQDFENLLESNTALKKEFEEQKRIKEVIKTMKMKNPSSELWDGYWERTYNRLERGLGWLAIFVGVLILMGFASIEFVSRFYEDNNIPVFVKIGIVSLVFGFLVLLFSVIREKLFTYKTDKYKEIQR